MAQLWKTDVPVKVAPEKQPYAGSAQKVAQFSGKEAYEKDIYGSMKNDEHPLKGTNKFEWDAPPYTYVYAHPSTIVYSTRSRTKRRRAPPVPPAIGTSRRRSQN